MTACRGSGSQFRPQRRGSGAALDIAGYFHRRRHSLVKFTPKRLADAQDYFEQALVECPDYAEALAGMALVRRTLPVLGWAPAQELMPLAKELALKALSINGPTPKRTTLWPRCCTSMTGSGHRLSASVDAR